MQRETTIMAQQSPTVGFVGLGRMGRPMCRNLLADGHRLVVHNRSPAKAEELASLGATVARTPRELAERCEVIITCLDSVEGTEALYLHEDGLAARARSGALLIDHATITPTLAGAIADAAQQRGIDFLDAPVSGGPEGAEKRTLAIMVGGSAAAFERAGALLQSYGGTVAHMGPPASGTRAKLVNQILTFVHGAAAAEAIALAQRFGLDLEGLGAVLRSSFGHSRMLDRTLARVADHNYVAGAALSLYEKDLRIVAEAGGDAAMTLPVTEGARRILSDALAEGLGDSDISVLRLRYP